MVFYAVRAGRQPGVYDYLEDALQQTRQYSYSDWRKFDEFDEALEYLDEELCDSAAEYVLVEVRLSPDIPLSCFYLAA